MCCCVDFDLCRRRLLLYFYTVSLFACSIHRRRKACLFGFFCLFVFFFCLFRFVFWSDFISDLWRGPSEALSFSYFFYNSPNSFQRKTRVFTKWSCGTREGRIRLCWTWRKQVRAFLNNPHHYFDNVWTSCLWQSFWNNILKYNDLTLFPKGYKAVLNEMFRVIGEFWLYFSSFCFLILAHRNGSLMLQGVNMTNERENPPPWLNLIKPHHAL